MIRKATDTDREILADLIRRSFRDVAERFTLTEQNCPKHPSNCTTTWIDTDLSRGVHYFLATVNDQPVGCIGVEHPTPGTCYLERLAVVPPMRGNHIGTTLVQHAREYAARLGAGTLSIGIIAEQQELRQWYERLGFLEVKTAIFPHLPFQVLFMECRLEENLCTPGS